MYFGSPMDKFDRLVQKEMSRYGFDLEIVRRIEADYDPATSTLEEKLEYIPVRGMVFDLTLQSNGDKTFGKTRIEAGDKQLLIQPPVKNNSEYNITIDDIKPESDYVIIKGNTYQIVTFKEINPSTTDSVLWELYIRK